LASRSRSASRFDRLGSRRAGRASPLEFSNLSPADALTRLRSSEGGLSTEEAVRRLATSGPNALPAGRRRSLLTAFFRNFVHVLALLLWIASLFAFVGGLPELGWAIIAVVVINGLFSFVQEYRAERLLEAMRRQVRATVRVRRDGVVLTIDALDLVPGDVILVSEGDRIAADARILDAAGVEVDQSSLTGESLAVSKGVENESKTGEPLDLTNVLYAGTLVVRGDAEAVVFATGPDSQFGTISVLTASVEAAIGPLQREIESLAQTTAAVAVIAGLAIWGISTVLLERKVSEGFVFAIGVIVALVPEGLLPTLSLSLAIGVQRMSRRNVLVRRLSAVEALGAVQVICTDKTGTLTLNEMTVARLWLPGAEFELDGAGGAPPAGPGGKEGVSRLLIAAVSASNAQFAQDNNHAETPTGDPTEIAILMAARDFGLDREGKRLVEFPFDSSRRMMSTVDSVDGVRTLHTKGAPDSVLERCASDPAGQPLSRRSTEEALEQAGRYAASGMRVLAAARRALPAGWEGNAESAERDLQFLGLIAMVDPIRPEAVEAIRRCHDAGIRIVIVTGDHPATAAAVAERSGIAATKPHVVTGQEIEQMSPDALGAALRRDVVFARATPVHKMTIVRALQDMGSVVAVIGDGVNDAPSLRQADVGVAMGKMGTDVAREAADIVLMDDNFATIVDAIEEGRAIFANIRKFVTYVFTSNVAELAPFAAFVLTGVPLPLKVLQILAVDLGTDMFPALGLGAEPPERGTLAAPPRPRGASLLNRAVLLRTFLVLGPVEAALGLAGYFFVYWSDGWRFGDPLADTGHTYVLATSMTFAAIVIGQVGNVFACRSQGISIFRLPPLGNRLLLVSLGVEVTLLLGLLYLPPFAHIFDFAALGWREWLFLGALLPVLPLVDELRKAIAAHLRRAQNEGPISRNP
jgi:Ca2+-transporting ATPase